MGVRGVDALLPEYDVNEVHRRVYDAGAAEVRAALEALRPSDLPLTRALVAVRGLPALLTGTRRPKDERTLVEGLAAGGFARLVDTPGEVVFAIVGRFWRPDGGRREPVADAAEFTAFAEPGWAKAVMSFELRPHARGTELGTETRVRLTSTKARLAFRAYWFVVGTGSALIRREILTAVGRRLAAGTGQPGPRPEVTGRST